MTNLTYKELLSDELWNLSVESDKRAFKFLFNKEFDSLLNYGLKVSKSRLLVSDAIQEVFIDLWENRVKRKDVSSIHFYLLKAVKYTILKSRQKNNIIDIDSFSQIQLHHYSLENKNIDLELKDHVNKVLNQIPTKQKEVLHLKYYQGLSNQQISELLNIKYQSVSNLLHRSINTLKEKILKKVSV